MAHALTVQEIDDEGGIALTLVDSGRQYTVTAKSLGSAGLSPNDSPVRKPIPCTHVYEYQLVPCQPEPCQSGPCGRQLHQLPLCQTHVCQLPKPLVCQLENIATKFRTADPVNLTLMPKKDTKARYKLIYPPGSVAAQHMSRRDAACTDAQTQPFASPQRTQICSGAQAVDGRYASTYQANYCNVTPTNPEIMTTEFPVQRAGGRCTGGRNTFVVGGREAPAPEGCMPANRGCSRNSSPVRNQLWTEHDMESRTTSTSPTRVSTFRSGTLGRNASYSNLHPSATHRSFARSLRQYSARGEVPRDRSSEVLERLVNYTNAKQAAKSLSPSGRMRSPDPKGLGLETELNSYRHGPPVKKTTGTIGTSTLDQHTTCRRLLFNKAVTGEQLPSQDKKITRMPYYTSPYVPYKEMYKKAENEFNERVKLSETIQAAPANITKHTMPGQERGRIKVAPFGWHLKREVMERRRLSRAIPGRLAKKTSKTQAKTWSGLMKKSFNAMTVRKPPTRNVKIQRGKAQKDVIPESKIAPVDNSSVTLMSRSSVNGLASSETHFHQLEEVNPNIPDHDIGACMRSSCSCHNSPNRKWIDDKHANSNGVGKSSSCQARHSGDANGNPDLAMHNAHKSTVEVLKAQMIGNNGMERYENLQTNNDMSVLPENSEAPEREREQCSVTRNISVTCIEPSEDQRKLYVKNSKSQQIVKPKTVKLHEEILYLLKDVPLQPSKDPTERMARREVLKKLFKKLRHLTNKIEMTKSDEDLLRNIRNCLKSVLYCEKCKKTKHSDLSGDKLSVAQSSAKPKRVITEDAIILKTLITRWFNNIEFKDLNNQQRERFLKIFVNKLQNQFQDRPSDPAEYRAILEGHVIDFLRELPIISESECRKTVLIHQLTNQLVEEIMVLMTSRQDIPAHSRQEHEQMKAFCNGPQNDFVDCKDSVIEPIGKELTTMITSALDPFLTKKKFINDVVANVEEDLAGILVNSFERIKKGREGSIKSELRNFLTETKLFSKSNAEKFAENLLDSLKQSFIIANARTEKDTATAGLTIYPETRNNCLRKETKIQDNSKHTTGCERLDNSKPVMKNNIACFKNTCENNKIYKTKTDFTVDSIQGVTDADLINNFRNYTRKLIQQIESWLSLFETQVPLAHDDGFRAVVVLDLARDIADRQKYLQLNPSKRATYAEESDYLEFQISKWINKIVGEKNNDVALTQTSYLKKQIQNIPVPMLTEQRKIHTGETNKTHQTLMETRTEPRQTQGSSVNIALDKDSIKIYEEVLKKEIKGWLEELPLDAKENSVTNVNSELVTMLVKDICQGVQESPSATPNTMGSVIDAKVPQLVEDCIKRTQLTLHYLNDSVELLKERILNIDVNALMKKEKAAKEEENAECCCNDLYEYPSSYCAVRKALDAWCNEGHFLDNFNRKLLDGQLDVFAHNLHEIILTPDLTYCEITKRLRKEIYKILDYLPLSFRIKAQMRADLVEDLWARIKHDSMKSTSLVKGKTQSTHVKEKLCYKCSSSCQVRQTFARTAAELPQHVKFSKRLSVDPAYITSTIFDDMGNVIKTLDESFKQKHSSESFQGISNKYVDAHKNSMICCAMSSETCSNPKNNRKKADCCCAKSVDADRSGTSHKKCSCKNLGSEDETTKISHSQEEPLIKIDKQGCCCAQASEADKSGAINKKVCAKRPGDQDDTPKKNLSLQEHANKNYMQNLSLQEPLGINQGKCPKKNTCQQKLSNKNDIQNSNLQSPLNINQGKCRKRNLSLQEPSNKNHMQNLSLQEPLSKNEGKQQSCKGTCSQHVSSTQQQDTNEVQLTPDKIQENLQKFVAEWCDKVPMDEVEPQCYSEAKKGLYYGMMKQIMKTQSDPLAIQDKFLTEDMLEERIDLLFSFLPETEELKTKTRSLKNELMEYVVNTNKQLHQIWSSQSYKQQLKEALNKTLPKPTQRDIVLLDMLEDNIIADFIQANYAGFDDGRRCAFHQKILIELTRWRREQGEETEPEDMEQIKAEVYNAMQQVPVPSDETLIEFVKECVVREEVTIWYKNLPVIHEDAKDRHDYTLKNLLAKRIIEIEKQSAMDGNDCTVQENVNHEISKFINKLRLIPGEDLNINFMVDELTNRMRNNVALNDPNLTLPARRDPNDETLFPELRHYYEFSFVQPMSSTLVPGKAGNPWSGRVPVQQDMSFEPYSMNSLMKSYEGDQEGINQANPSNQQCRKDAAVAVRDKKNLNRETVRSVDGQNPCGSPSRSQQSRCEQQVATSETMAEQRAANTRRVLGTSQVAGPSSCCKRILKSSDVMFKSVMEWTHQIPFDSSVPDNTKQALRAEVATRLIAKIGELNLDQNVLLDDLMYEGMLRSAVDHILESLPQSQELGNAKSGLTIEIIQRLQQARNLALTELHVHNYRKAINETIIKTSQGSSKGKKTQNAPDAAAVENIADTLIEVKYDELDTEVCMKKLVDAIEKNTKDTKKKGGGNTQVKLAKALVALPAPTADALAEEVEEVKIKKDVYEWYKKLPLIEDPFTPEDLNKTSRLISLLAKEIHELEKDSSAMENYLDLLKAELTHWVEMLAINPNKPCKVKTLINEFAQEIKDTTLPRRLQPPKPDDTSSVSSFQSTQSLSKEPGEFKEKGKGKGKGKGEKSSGQTTSSQSVPISEQSCGVECPNKKARQSLKRNDREKSEVRTGSGQPAQIAEQSCSTDCPNQKTPKQSLKENEKCEKGEEQTVSSQSIRATDQSCNLCQKSAKQSSNAGSDTQQYSGCKEPYHFRRQSTNQADITKEGGQPCKDPNELKEKSPNRSEITKVGGQPCKDPCQLKHQSPTRSELSKEVSQSCRQRSPNRSEITKEVSQSSRQRSPNRSEITKDVSQSYRQQSPNRSEMTKMGGQTYNDPCQLRQQSPTRSEVTKEVNQPCKDACQFRPQSPNRSEISKEQYKSQISGMRNNQCSIGKSMRLADRSQNFNFDNQQSKSTSFNEPPRAHRSSSPSPISEFRTQKSSENFYNGQDRSDQPQHFQRERPQSNGRCQKVNFNEQEDYEELCHSGRYTSGQPESLNKCAPKPQRRQSRHDGLQEGRSKQPSPTQTSGRQRWQTASPPTTAVCHRPDQYAKKSQDSAASTDDENINLYCKCSSGTPRQIPMCYFKPPCQLDLSASTGSQL